MAKKKPSKTRDARSPAFATGPVRSQVKKPSRPTLLTTIEDLRHLPSLAHKPARLFSSAVAKINPAPALKKNFKARVSHKIAFTAPGRTIICVRRGIRKSVLHALGKTGKGGQRKARHTQWSKIKC